MSNLKKTQKTPKDDINKLRVVLDYRLLPKYQPAPKPANSESYNVVKCVNPLIEQCGQDLQAIFVNLRWNTSDGVTLEQFRQFEISDSMMNNGLLFIWSEKDNIMEIIDHLDSQGFNYVENFTMVLLSEDKILEQPLLQQTKVKKITDFFASKKDKKDVKEQSKKNDMLLTLDQLPDVDPCGVFWNEQHQFFNKAKRTLLMFRKQSKQVLELRHQRTGDIFFDVVKQDCQSISPIGLEYIYKMIETLLPKAKYVKGQPLKMMELFANKNTEGREGWIQLVNIGDLQ